MSQHHQQSQSVDTSANIECKDHIMMDTERKSTIIGKDNSSQEEFNCASSSTLNISSTKVSENSRNVEMTQASEKRDEHLTDKQPEKLMNAMDDVEETFHNTFEYDTNINQRKKKLFKHDHEKIITESAKSVKTIDESTRGIRYKQISNTPSRLIMGDGDCNDLSLVLPEEDCLFLAEKFWIFTVQQILSVLEHKTPVNAKSCDQHIKQNPTTEECIIEALMKSTLVQSDSTQETKKQDILPNEKRESIDSMDIHDPEAVTQLQSPTISEDKEKDQEIVDYEIKQQQQQQLRKKAMLRITEWKKLLNEVASQISREAKNRRDGIHQGEFQNISPEEFYLNGPLSILLPNHMLQFFESENIRTAHAFFSYRKTESSALISSFVKWRESRELMPLKCLILSRYLTSLCTRIQYAVTLCPPANEFERNWIGSCLCVLTGSSREFLINICKFQDPVKFLLTRTKELSKLVVDWRESRGMQPLKGSGKVAVISGWKTIVKETIDANVYWNQSLPATLTEDKTSDENETMNDTKVSDNSSLHTDSTGSKTEGHRKRKMKENRELLQISPHIGNNGVQCLTKRDQLKAFVTSKWSLSVLKSSNTSFLNSVGIENAEQFFVANKRASGELVTSYVQWRAEKGHSSMQISSAERTLNKWAQKVAEKLNEVCSLQNSNFMFGENSCLEPTDLSESTDLILDQNNLEEKKSIHKSTRSMRTDIFQKLTKNPDGPLSKLSENTRRFLESMDISDSQGLLKTPSSFIAEKYIQWREKNGITPLKGNGAIATISGWKNTVRECSKSSISKDYSNLESSRPRKMRKKPSIFITSKNREKNFFHKHNSNSINLLTKPYLLFGMPFFRFTVFNPIREIFYEFKISLRKKSSPNGEDELGIYCTYLGGRIFTARQKPGTTHKSDVSNRMFCNKNPKHCGFLPILPEMEEKDIAEFEKNYLFDDVQSSKASLTDTRYLTFCSKDVACGLIDLTSFNIFPEKSECRLKKIMAVFDNFISCIFCKPPILKSENQPNVCCESIFSLEDNAKGEEDESDKKSLDNSPIKAEVKHISDANVFPCSLSSDRNNHRYLLYINENLETGQTVELFLGPLLDGCLHNNDLGIDLLTTEFDLEKNVKDRDHIIRLAKSLSLRELQHIIVSLNGAFQPIDNDVKLFLNNRNEIANESSREKILKHIIICRRFNWMADILMSQLNELIKKYSKMKLEVPCDDENIDQLKMKQMLSEMAWKPFYPKEVEFIVDFSEGYLFSGLQQELYEEILSSLSVNNSLIHPFDDRFWCQMSSSLLFDLLDLFSSHILLSSTKTYSLQWNLFQKLVHRVNRAIQLVEEACETTGDTNIGFRRSRLDSLSFIPTGVAVSPRTQNLAQFRELKIFEKNNHSSSNETLFKVPTENVLFCEKNIEANPLSDVLNNSSTVNKQWYISNQILHVAHCIASFGLVNWTHISPNGHTCALYSLNNLKNTLLQLNSDYKEIFQNIDFRFISCPSILAFLKPLPTSMGQLNLPMDKKQKLFPKSLPFFLRTVWPILNSIGWRLVYKSPTDISFESPIMNKYKGGLDKRNIFLRGNCFKYNKLLNGLTNERQIRMPWILQNILIKSTTGATNDDVKARSKNTVKIMMFKLSELILSQGVICETKKCKQIHLVLDSVRILFDELVVNYMTPREIAVYDELMKERERCEFLGCEFFLRFAITLPRDLAYSSISEKEIASIVYVVELTLNFLALNCDEYFNSNLLPPHFKRPDFKPFMTMSLVSDLSGQIDKPDEATQQICCHFSQKLACDDRHLERNNTQSVDPKITSFGTNGIGAKDIYWDQHEERNRLVFRDHVDLIQFLFISDCFKQQPDILKEIKKYYLLLAAS